MAPCWRWLLFREGDRELWGCWQSSSYCYVVVVVVYIVDFNQDGKPDNISFMVKRIKVHSMEALKDSNYRFPLNYGVEKFLELFSGT